eukprot:6211189-Pleurochrysis_carterae.AAC.3
MTTYPDAMDAMFIPAIGGETCAQTSQSVSVVVAKEHFALPVLAGRGSIQISSKSHPISPKFGGRRMHAAADCSAAHTLVGVQPGKADIARVAADRHVRRQLKPDGKLDAACKQTHTHAKAGRTEEQPRALAGSMCRNTLLSNPTAYVDKYANDAQRVTIAGNNRAVELMLRECCHPRIRPF